MQLSVRDRVRGAVLAAAVGDAMGHPSEFVSSFDALRDRFGPSGVTGYALWWTGPDGKRFAPYTDDTQMTEATLRVLVSAHAVHATLEQTMQALAQAYVAWAHDPQGGHRAPGQACLRGCRRLADGVRWDEAGGADAGGCGSVMRVLPFGLLYAHEPARAEAWAVAHSKLTHRAPIALAACAGMTESVVQCLRGLPLSAAVDGMICAAARYDADTAAMLERARDEALRGVPPEVTLQRLQGWAAHEALAAATYVALRHPDDLRGAILEGANTPGDSDSIATLAGALLGAHLGFGALPSEWVAQLERSSQLQALADEAAEIAAAQLAP